MTAGNFPATRLRSPALDYLFGRLQEATEQWDYCLGMNYPMVERILAGQEITAESPDEVIDNGTYKGFKYQIIKTKEGKFKWYVFINSEGNGFSGDDWSTFDDAEESVLRAIDKY
jgi:hypothetical protein